MYFPILKITFSLSQCTFILLFCQPHRELKKKRWIRLRNISSLQKTKKMQNHWISLNSMYPSVYPSIHPSTYSPYSFLCHSFASLSLCVCLSLSGFCCSCQRFLSSQRGFSVFSSSPASRSVLHQFSVN